MLNAAQEIFDVDVKKIKFEKQNSFKRAFEFYFSAIRVNIHFKVTFKVSIKYMLTDSICI